MVKCVANNVFKVICNLIVFVPFAVNATELSCDLFVNGTLEESFVADLTPELKTKVASSSGLTFYLTEKESPRYLIEVFDPNVPARSYAEGVLITPKDQLKWSMWSREIWVELVCSLNK